MNDPVTINFLRRAADRTGLVRTKYADANAPTLPSNILAIPFFGDIRSTCLLSEFILKRYKEHRPKYTILCSWPGWDSVFPYVDEYWTVRDDNTLQALAYGASNFYNTADINISLTRNMIQNFDHVLTNDDLSKFYHNGFQPEFWDTFHEIKRFLPEIPSSARVSDTIRIDMSRRKSPFVVVHPGRNIRSWQMGRQEMLHVGRDFWAALLNRLISEGFTPIVYQDKSTHDMSGDFTDRCVWLVGQDIGQVMSVFRMAGCVLDIHTGISNLAAMARCPYIVVDERERYLRQKDNEIDDLMPEALHKSYIWSFATLLLSGNNNEWNVSVIDIIVARLRSFLASAPQSLGTSATYENVSYDRVRERKSQRMGLRFIRKY